MAVQPVASDFRFPQTYEELMAMPQLASATVLYRDSVGYRALLRFLPGVILKHGGEFVDEILCMRVAKEAGLPVPTVIFHPGSLEIKCRWTIPRITNVWYYCMEEVPGVPLSSIINTLSDDKLASLASQLRACLDLLSNVQHNNTIGSADGKAFQNLPVPPYRQPEQPFQSVAEFNDFIASFYKQCVSPPSVIAQNISRLPSDASIRFTHGELLPKHIMVDAGGEHITGIVDWGHSGFYPSYWEYCLMHNTHYMKPGWDKMLSIVFPEPRRQKEIDAVHAILSAIDIQLC